MTNNREAVAREILAAVLAHVEVRDNTLRCETVKTMQAIRAAMPETAALLAAIEAKDAEIERLKGGLRHWRGKYTDETVAALEPVDEGLGDYFTRPKP